MTPERCFPSPAPAMATTEQGKSRGPRQSWRSGQRTIEAGDGLALSDPAVWKFGLSGKLGGDACEFCWRSVLRRSLAKMMRWLCRRVKPSATRCSGRAFSASRTSRPKPASESGHGLRADEASVEPGRGLRVDLVLDRKNRSARQGHAAAIRRRATTGASPPQRRRSRRRSPRRDR